MFIPLTPSRGFELKDAFESIWYPYKLSGVSQDKCSWGHIESFMFNRYRSKVAVVVFHQDLVSESHVDGGGVDHVGVKGLNEPG